MIILILTAVHVQIILNKIIKSMFPYPENWYGNRDHEVQWISIRKIAAINRDGHNVIILLYNIFQNKAF